MLPKIYPSSAVKLSEKIEYAPETKPRMDKEISLHQTLRNMLVIAQLFGQLPLQGVISPTPKSLHFTFKSPGFVYCLFPFTGTIFMMCMLIYKMIQTGSDLFIITTFIYHLCNLGRTLSLFYMATKWPILMKQWHTIEMHMKTHYGWPAKLELRIHTIAIIVGAIAIIEYFANHIGNYILAKRCKSDGETTLEYFYKTLTFPFIFSMLSYQLWSAIILHVVDFFSGFTWCYGDLFIMIMSSAVAVRFGQITQRLRTLTEDRWRQWKVEGARRDDAQEVNDLWKEIREDYNKLCVLCRALDDSISYLVLMSYSTNLFFILIQLFNSLRNMGNTMQKIYFFFSFGFLIIRTIAVSLYAAWVNDESKKPILILNSIPSHLYNLEIKRFVQQISFDSVSLTGRNFFNVTRGLILNIAGAIVTYELVLIQFNENLLKEDIKTNHVDGCLLK